MTIRSNKLFIRFPQTKLEMKIKHIILLATICIAGCDQKQTKEQEKAGHEEPHGETHGEAAHGDDEDSDHVVELTPAQYKSAGIEIGGITTRNLSDVVAANGVIDIPPSNLVSISAPMGGFIRKTELLQGMKVRKGQILAVIENPDFIQIQQDFLETESELEYAEKEYARQEELSVENVTAKKVFQQAATQARTLKARLAGLTERLRTANINLTELKKGIIVNHANVISPLSGSVTAVNVNIGKYVSPTDVMFEITDTDHLHVELSVFERDISRLKIGQLVRFSVNGNKEGLAKVYLINPKINDDRTVRVHCHLVKDDPALLPQNYVKAIIETGTHAVDALPEQAITDFENKSYIFVEKDKHEESNKNVTFEMIEVQKGVSEGGYTQISFPEERSGQQRGIVVKGAYTLLSKLKNSEEGDHHH
jgi:cobalt-zinc-cadmium efflux system membrane fusion protein